MTYSSSDMSVCLFDNTNDNKVVLTAWKYWLLL